MVLGGVEARIGMKQTTPSATAPGEERTTLRLVPSGPDSEPTGEPATRSPEEIAELLSTYESKVRMALLARYGPELMDDLTAECMAWAWENHERLTAMVNPVGYLIRVGQSRSRRLTRWRRERTRYPRRTVSRGEVWVEPKLPSALDDLDADTRTAVVLVHSFQWTYAEVAELLELPLHTVRNRIHRGLLKLRHELGANDD